MRNTVHNGERNSDRITIDGYGLQQCGIGLYENEGNYNHTLCSDCIVVADLANEGRRSPVHRTAAFSDR